MTSRRLSLRVAFGLGAALFAASPVGAQTSQPATSSGWEFQATPYIWGVGLDGEVGVGRLAATGVEASFSDILNNLEIALMGTFDGRSGRWGFVVDAFYADLASSQPTPGEVFGDADVELVDQIYTGFAYYRVKEGACSVDVLFGPRYTTLDTDLTLTSGIAAGRTASGGVAWWDALVAGRLSYTFEKGWVIGGYAGVGGGQSELTYDALVMGGYRFKKLVTLSAGYRYLSVDYDDDGVVYDMAMAGPFLGVGFRF